MRANVRRCVDVSAAEDGTGGIYVHAEGFLGGRHSANEFGFMQTEVSRERPVDYAVLAQLLGEEKLRGGKIVWVIGPALVHARARQDMIWFISNGYVGALLGGNAVAARAAERVAAWLRRASAERLGDALTVLGPAPCPIQRLKGRWRWHVLVKSAEPRAIGRVVRAWGRGPGGGGRGGVIVDRDPVAVL